MRQLKNQASGTNEKLFIENYRKRELPVITQILEIVVVTLIKTKYIKSIKHHEHGVLLQDPKSMENYFKECLKTFKEPW